MLDTLLAKVVGTQNDRELKRLRPIVAEVNALEPGIQALSDTQLRGKTVEFRQRLTNGELPDFLPDTAGVREVGLSAAREAVGDDVLGQWLTQDVPRAVVEGGPLPPRPEMRKRRGFRLRLRR